ncbi:MAG TPA: carboxylesterase family protein [Chitinophagales bacterium]|nr:carboxylesterase family protein [Chitinophagales bacterium]
MQKTELNIEGAKGKTILMDITYLPHEKPKPIILFCHGFKGFKDWGHFNLIADEFAKNNFVFIKFSFSHNGTTAEHPTDFVDLDAFGKNNFSIELEDIDCVLDYIYKNATSFNGNSEQITLIGHSRGGGISILKAANTTKIQQLVTWASIKDLNDFFSKININNWESTNIEYTYNTRTKQNLPLYFQLYEDYLLNKEKLNIQKSANSIHIPWLIIHGTKDNSVPVECANSLHQWNRGSKLALIPNADHTFGGKHPWATKELSDFTKELIKETLLFLAAKN